MPEVAREIPQDKLWTPLIEDVLANKAVLDIPLERVGIDPEQRVNLPDLAFAIGRTSTLPEKEELEPMTDKALDIYRNNFLQGSVKAIESGLYIPPRDERFKSANLIITIGHQPCELERDGVVGRRTGVIFPADEFKIVARNARDFVKHVKAQSLAKNADNPDKEEVEQTALRAAARAMTRKIDDLDDLEQDIIDERQLLIKVYRQAKGTNRGPRYKAKNLDKLRKQADEIIHNTAETSAINRNLGTISVKAMHKAIMSSLYRRGSNSQVAYNLGEYTAMAGRYATARRGKVWQSRRDCAIQLIEYAPSLEAVD